MSKSYNITHNQQFKLNHELYQAIQQEKNKYEDARAASIEALKMVQKQYGWVSDNAIQAIANALGISASDVEEVATFYSNIFRQPVGRYIIRYCNSVVCYIMGYQTIQTTLENFLNIKPGHTTPDGRFTLLPTCCLGNCDKGPTLMINNDTYVYLTANSICQLLEKYL